MNDWLSKIRQFIADTISELKKCSWPNREELFQSTLLVIVSVVILALFVSGVDLVGRMFINFLTTMK